MISRLITTFVLALLLLTSSSAQSGDKDSLLHVIGTTKIDTVKIDALKNLALMISRSDPAQAETYCKQCIDIAEKAGYYQGLIKCHNILGITYIYRNDYAAAIKQFNISLEKATRINDQMAIFRVYNNLGSICISMSDYEQAVINFSKALAFAEKLGDRKSMAMCYNNIAIIHKGNKDYSRAMEYYQKALDIGKELNDEMLIGQVYGNITTIKFLQKEHRQAITYSLKALAIQIKQDDRYGMGISYANLGENYLALSNEVTNKIVENANIDSSRFYYEKALETARDIDDEQRICISKIGLGNICMARGEYKKAHRYYNEGLEISKKIDMIEITMDAVSSLSAVEEVTGNYKDALEHYKLFKSYNDSIYSVETRSSISEMEIKYQTEKKQKEIEMLNHEKDIDRLRNRILAGGFGVLLIFTGLVLSAFHSKRKDNKLLKLKNSEINSQRAEIQKQADSLAEANHEITLQKELIEKSHVKITDSINYARYIQSAALPRNESVQRLLPLHFIMFLPRDTVSGDFYFVKKVHDKIYIAVADCTGHGVPGAFMSMLGMAILNELVSKPDISNAAELLDIMRLQVKSSLQQTGEYGEQREGMDIALCILDENSREMSYAGAYNPLWLYRKKSGFEEIAADRQPVGIHMKEKPFTNHTIQLHTGDTFYLFSDGLYSQFGGANGDKLKVKRFQEMISGIVVLPMEQQKSALELSYANWKGNEIQIDDILVMGVKI